MKNKWWIFVVLLLLHLNSISCNFTHNGTIYMSFVFSGLSNDLGWSHMHYVARRNLQRTLQQTYTNITFKNTYDVAQIQTDEAEMAMRKRINQGAKIVFGCDYWFEDIMIELSKEFPNVTFVNSIGAKLAGDNYIVVDLRAYQVEYMLGYIGGKMTKTNKIGRIIGFRVPYSYTIYGAFLKGAKAANPNVTGYVICMNSWGDPEKEIGAVNIFKANGIDFMGGSTHEGAFHNQDILTVGEYYDWELNAGESVVASSVPSWEYLYLDILNHLIQNGSVPYTKIWAGLDFKPGPPLDISQLSVNVDRKTAKSVYKLRNEFVAGKDDIYCGPMLDVNGNVVIENGTCINDTVLSNWNHLIGEDTIDIGDYRVPNRECTEGTYWELDYVKNDLSCHPCQPGTASKRPIENKCFPCPAGYYAKGEGNTNCTLCPSGYFSEIGAITCIRGPLPWFTWVLAFGLPFLMLLIGTCLLCVSFLIFYYLYSYIRRQRRILHTAENISTSIAMMDLENEELVSLFSTPPTSGLDIQFRKIIENLRVYRPYLPDTLFAKDQLDDQVKLCRAVSFSSSRNQITPLARGNSLNLSQYSTQSPEEEAGMALALLQNRMRYGLELKTCTLMVVDFKDLNRIAENAQPESLVVVMNQALNKLTTAVKRNNGVIHSIQGDKILCSWNAVSIISKHPKNAVESAIRFMKEIDKKKAQWARSNLPVICPSIALYTGDCLCGTIGSNHLRSYNLIGHIVNIAFAMTKINRWYHTTLLMNDECMDYVKFWCKYRIVDRVNFYHHRSQLLNSEVLYEVLPKVTKEERDHKWLVSSTMTEDDDSAISLRHYNLGMKQFMKKNIEEAQTQFKKAISQDVVAPNIAEHIARINLRIEHHNIEPPVYIIHREPQLVHVDHGNKEEFD